MEKREFTYQRFFSRVFATLILACVVTSLFVLILGKLSAAFYSYGIYIGIALICLGFCFQYTQSCKLFIGKGKYWVEDGIVVIEIGKKVYKLNDVKTLLAKKISFFGYSYSKTGILKIGNGHKTIELMSLSNKDIKIFSDSELFPLFETILENNPQLKKDDALEFYYENKKDKMA